MRVPESKNVTQSVIDTFEDICGNSNDMGDDLTKHLNQTLNSTSNTSTDSTKGFVSSENTTGLVLFAKLLTGELSRKYVNFHTMVAPTGNGANVAISMDSVRVVHEQLSNTVYEFVLGKRVVYPVVENYVKNTWSKYVIIKSMMTTNDIFFFKFGSKYEMDDMIENDPVDTSMMLKLQGFDGPKKIVSDMLDNLKNSRQAVRGVQFDPKLGTRAGELILAEKGANSDMMSSAHGTTADAFDSSNTTPLSTRINKIERQMQCLRKVADGHFTAAVKVLSSSGVAPYCDDTIKALEAKHPYRPPPSMPSNTFSEPPLVAEIDCVLGCIKSFIKGTSCGRDGLRAQHILDALCGEGSATATDLLKAITLVVNLWLAGRCPPILAEFVASAPLTPLLKPDNGIRPIAVGTIWRRLVSKVAMKGVGKEMSKYLGDFQFGVGVSGGAEAVLHSANRVLSEYHNDGSLAMLTVDFSNAFNLVDRSALLHEVRVRCPSISLWVDFLYGQATRLYIGDTHIWSATGVQQGDPLGPLLFALVLHPLIHKIRDSCKLLLHAWYLDDGTVIGDSEEVSRVLDIITVSGPGLGLELNIKKTEIFWPSCNGTKLREGLFPVDIRRPPLSVKLLGGAVSRDANFISGLAMRRAANAVDLMSLLPQLHDQQSKLLLLRSCMGIAKLFFCLRTCQPVHMEKAALFFDKGLRGSVENIVVCGGPFFGDLQWSLASLPIQFGGLGLYSAKVGSSYAFVASRAQYWVLKDHILCDSGICGMDVDYASALACLRDTIPSIDFNVFTNKDTAPSKAQQTLVSALFSEMVKDLEVRFDMTVRQKAVFECLRAPHAQDFLLAIPIDGLGQHMSLVEYRTILKYRLMILLFPVDAICPVCRKACLDSFGEHAVHCKELSGFKYRHDMVRDVLFDMRRAVRISVKKEAPVNFLTDPSDGRSTLRPVDVLVFRWVGGKHACVDLTGVSPFSTCGFIAVSRYASANPLPQSILGRVVVWQRTILEKDMETHLGSVHGHMSSWQLFLRSYLATISVGEVFDRILAKGHYSEWAATSICRSVVNVGSHNSMMVDKLPKDVAKIRSEEVTESCSISAKILKGRLEFTNCLLLLAFGIGVLQVIEKAFVDGSLRGESKDFEVRGQEEVNSTYRNNFSPVRISNSKDSSNDIKGEGDTQKKDQDKVRLSDSENVIKALLDEPNTQNSFSPVRLSDSENMINALMGESYAHKENQKKGHSESCTSKQGEVMNDWEDTNTNLCHDNGALTYVIDNGILVRYQIH
ncbi:putative reverse transcriptase domain-containing protein [Tanacetum coccineum]